MKKRKLGQSNLEVSALGPDCVGMSSGSDKITFQGARYLDYLQKLIGR